MDSAGELPAPGAAGGSLACALTSGPWGWVLQLLSALGSRPLYLALQCNAPC